MTRMGEKRIAVIGGGAAGMMAACAAAGAGAQVVLREKNEKLGKKLYITGKGRCNLTNDCVSEAFFENVVRNSRFLYSAYSGFDNRAAMDFFEGAGCRLKTERGGRVFPVSDHASDVTAALERRMRALGVQIRLRTGAARILTDRFGRAAGVLLENGGRVEADAVILATGGLSYPSTGSTGDGYGMAEALGHTVVPCAPALVPLEVRESWCAQLQGLSLKNVSVSLVCGKRECYRGFGEMLFTHFGVSGPLILSASSYYGGAESQDGAGGRKPRRDAGEPEARRDGAKPREYTLCIDLKPALTEEQLDRRLLREFEAGQNRLFRNALDGLFPARLIPVMVSLCGIDPARPVHAVTRQERKRFAELIRCLPLTVTGTRGFAEAVITRGGVRTGEVNPSTMGSKRTPGLYFAGEVLDLDALTGGFNLQIAWATGYLAGRSAAGSAKGKEEERI